MKKRILSLALALAMVFLFSSAFAADAGAYDLTPEELEQNIATEEYAAAVDAHTDGAAPRFSDGWDTGSYHDFYASGPSSYMIAIGIILMLALGLLMLISPNFVWKVGHIFTVKGGEPTELYLNVVRLFGVIFLFLSIILALIMLIN